jgi:hypothetical protein
MTWDDITIGQWYEIGRISEEYADLPLKGQLMKWAFLEGASIEEFRKIKQSRLNQLREKYAFLNSPITERLVDEWNGYRIERNFKRITAGQFIDIEALSAQGGENAHKIMAVLATGPLDYEERHEMFLRQMPVTISMGVSSFFFRRFYKLLKRSRFYFRLQMAREIRRLKILS